MEKKNKSPAGRGIFVFLILMFFAMCALLFVLMTARQGVQGYSFGESVASYEDVSETYKNADWPDAGEFESTLQLAMSEGGTVRMYLDVPSNDEAENYALMSSEDGRVFTVTDISYDDGAIVFEGTDGMYVTVLCINRVSPDLSGSLEFLQKIGTGAQSASGFMKGNIMTIIFVILIILVAAVLFKNIRIVPQEHTFIIERLGRYHTAWTAGLHVKIPFIDRVAKTISLKEQVLDFPPQPVITKDNVTMQIDSVVFIKVFDPKLFTYGAEDPIGGLKNLTATTLRSIVGDMELDQTLTSREAINAKMQAQLDEATDKWGIQVIRVEIKNIQPPKEISDVMTKQMRAEREKREQILEAEAHRQSVETKAEGDKKAAILKAEAEKEAAILDAEAKKQARVLAADAEREAKIKVAEGEAEAIELVYKAQADGLGMLKDADVSDSVLKLKSIEALKDVADGKATKIYMPSDIANAVTSLGIAGEALGLTETKEE